MSTTFCETGIVRIWVGIVQRYFEIRLCSLFDFIFSKLFFLIRAAKISPHPKLFQIMCIICPQPPTPHLSPQTVSNYVHDMPPPPPNCFKWCAWYRYSHIQLNMAYFFCGLSPQNNSKKNAGPTRSLGDLGWTASANIPPQYFWWGVK